jgi:transglutaminase-like putative cysteine protease
VHYLIEHETHVTFATAVREHHCEVRLTPRASPAQRVVRPEVHVEPGSDVLGFVDYFANQVHAIGIVQPHSSLVLSVRAEVETLLANPFDYASVAVRHERDWVDRQLHAVPRLWDFVLHRSAWVPELTRGPIRQAVAWPAWDASRSLLENVQAASAWLHQAFRERAPDEPPPATLEEMLAAGTATPGDLAHALVALVRSWEFAARYACGYREVDSEEGWRLEPHAWAEVLVPGAGWRGFDPDSQLVANDTFITLAVGRDVADTVALRCTYKDDATTGTTRSTVRGKRAAAEQAQ